MIDLDDARSEAIAEVLSNKTSKKVLGALAEGEKSASDIASSLKLPLNTVGYNLKKLVDAGLIERSKGFFWSSKGKKMELYKVANKKIVIMPKQMVKGILPVALVSLVAAVGIRQWTLSSLQSANVERATLKAADFYQAAGSAPTVMAEASNFGSATVVNLAQSAWLWFLVGAFFALFVYLIWNLRRK